MSAYSKTAALKQEVERIFREALVSHNPSVIVYNALREHHSKLKDYKSVEIVATGKSAVDMAKGALRFFGDRVSRGLIITNSDEPQEIPPFEILVSSHPLPDERSLFAGERLIGFCRTVPPDSLLIYLLSGGTSAMAVAPVDGITLEDKRRLTAILMNGGIEIENLNEVRTSVSKIKGGGLLNFINTEHILNLIISDVLSDDVRVIGSGMLVPSEADTGKTRDILQRFSDDTDAGFIDRILKTLQKTDASIQKSKFIPETRIIDSNRKFLHTLADFASESKMEFVVCDDPLTGNVEEAATAFFEKCRITKERRRISGLPFLIIAGAEPGVTVKGEGTGGRACEFAMRFSRLIAGREAVLLAAGTDGKDGTTSFAGAVIDGDTFPESLKEGLDFDRYLNSSNSGEWIARTGSAVRTGHTGVNLTDILIYGELE
ncbi:MAG: DUF4147 domain-containing protein [Bacteroidetes bacterium]|nr:DUF4147 domain-containing protein [Bacteroidota bacterium]